MNQLKFDENLAIREVLDDIIGMVDRREKLIESATEKAEKTRDERMTEHVRQLEQLMGDFLVLFEPILSKVRIYAEDLKGSVSEAEAFLRSLVGIIDAGKAIDGTSATVQELEKDADETQEEINLSTETLDKIEDLFKRTKQYAKDKTLEKPEVEQGHEESVQARRTLSRVESRPLRSHVFSGSRFSSNEPSKSQH